MPVVRTYPAFTSESGTLVPMLVVYTVPDVVDTVRRLVASMESGAYTRAETDSVTVIGTHRATGERVHYIMKGE